MLQLSKLEDLDIQFIDGDRGENYPSRDEFYENEYCLFLDANNITSNGFDFSSTHFITKEKDTKLRNGKLQRNDIVIMTRGSVGNIALYDNSIKFPNIRINSGMLIIRCGKLINPLNVYYQFKSPIVIKQINDFMSGSVQKQLPVSILKEIKIFTCSKNNANFLKLIDDKIALNNKTNTELENMAKTIYDYWFTQFDFPDKNGHPYKTSGGQMVYNETLKREIPAGWKAGCFGDLIEIGNGKDHSKLDDGDFPVYGSGGLMRKVNKSLYSGESVLFPRKGTLNNVMYVNETFWTVDTMFYSIPKNQSLALYVYYNAKHFDFEKMNTGTGVPSMTSSIIKELPIIIPDTSVLDSFDETIQPIYQKVFSNRKENTELTKLRDYLLPLLMNGQIEVK